MATAFEDKIRSLEKIRASMPSIIMKEAIKHRKWIQKVNREQLMSGQRADGSSMPDYVGNSKSPSAPGPIKLFDTGDFHQGIEPLFDNKGIELIGMDSKTNLLTGKYGKLIMGLNDKNIDELRRRMLPGIQRAVSQMI